jgi:hypothetical protein
MKGKRIGILDVWLNTQVFASVRFMMMVIIIAKQPSLSLKPSRKVTGSKCDAVSKMFRNVSFVAHQCEPTLLSTTKMRADGGRIPEESP